MKHQLSDIVGRHPALSIVGKPQRTITHVAQAKDENFNENSIGWVSDKNISLLATIRNGCVICSAAVPEENFLSEVTYIVVENPRLYFLKMVADFFVEKEPAFISKHAIIDPTAIIGKNVTIQSGVVVEKDCMIGDDT